MKRFCPGCTARKLEMNAAPCAMCGRVNLASPSVRARKMHLLARLMRALLATLGWFTHLSTLVFCVFALWAMTVHWVFAPSSVAARCGALAGLLAASIWMSKLATRGAVYVFAPTPRRSLRPGRQWFWVLPICATNLVVLNHSDIPLRLAFWVNRPALERVALQTLSGTTTPVRGGFYRIQQSYYKYGDANQHPVRLQVTRKRTFGGLAAGFAFCPQGCTNSDPNGSDTPGAIFYIPLAKHWCWWEQDTSWMAPDHYAS